MAANGSKRAMHNGQYWVFNQNEKKAQIYDSYTPSSIEVNQEKMKGQRGRLPVQPLGYVMSTKVIFRRAEVCLPGRQHAGQPRSDV